MGVPSEEELSKGNNGIPICDGKPVEGGEGSYKPKPHEPMMMQRV
jgi:hypothetical protein